MSRAVKYTHKLPIIYCTPELLAFAENEGEQCGGVSVLMRGLLEQFLRGRGYPIGDDANRAEKLQRRIAELRAEIAPRQPKPEHKAVPAWE